MWSGYSEIDKCIQSPGIGLTSSDGMYTGMIYVGRRLYRRRCCTIGGYSIVTDVGSGTYDPAYFTETHCKDCPRFNNTTHYINDRGFITQRR